MSKFLLSTFLPLKIGTLMLVSYSLNVFSVEPDVTLKSCHDAVVQRDGPILNEERNKELNKYDPLIKELVGLRLSSISEADDVRFSEGSGRREVSSPWHSIIANSLLREKQMELETKLGKERAAAILREVQRRVMLVLNGKEGSDLADSKKRSHTVTPEVRERVFRPKLLHTLDGIWNEVKSAQFSPDGKQIITITDDASVRVWNAVNGKPLFNLSSSSVRISNAKYSPDGTMIVKASLNPIFRYEENEPKVSVVEAETGKPLFYLPATSKLVRSVEFSLDGTKLVTTSHENIAKVWSETGEFLYDLKADSGEVTSARFSPDSQRIITTQTGGMAKVWNARTGEFLFDLSGAGVWANSASYSPNGKLILTLSPGGIAKVWNAETGIFLYDFQSHAERVDAAEFSPDSSKIVIVSKLDKVGWVWEAEKGTFLFELNGHTRGLMNAQFSPDGTAIVTASLDGKAKIWSAETGKFVLDLEGHTDWVTDVQFSPDGQRIATASRDHTAIIWSWYEDIYANVSLPSATPNTGGHP